MYGTSGKYPVRGGTVSSWCQGQWTRHREAVMRLAVTIMACVALLWLSYESFRFAWQPTEIGGRPILAGALDLKVIHDLTERWFRGEPIYRTFGVATHPPASYAIFWLLAGWSGMRDTVAVWAFTAAACLAVLIRISVRASCADSTLERTLVALLPLAMYATGATIGNGQITIHVMSLTAAALVCLRPQGLRVIRGLLGVLLFLAALAKPLVSAPFFWIVLFVPGTLWPAALVVLGYAVLTGFSVSFQSGGVLLLVSEWLTRGEALGTTAGESNLHIWMSGLGFEGWILPASFVVLGILGVWVYRHRRGDLWVLMGVSAIAARFWAYHRWYDDLLLLFPMVALFRVAKTSRRGDVTGTWAGVVFALTLASTLAPGGLYVLPDTWQQAYLIGQTLVWASALVLLVSMERGVSEPLSPF